MKTPSVRCIGLVISLTASASAAQTSAHAFTPTVADWRASVDEVVNDVRLLHPNPFTKTGRLAFDRRAASLKAALPSLTEEQRAVELMELVASIGDGHTLLELERPDFASWYPIRLYSFSDGLFISAAHKSVQDLAGAQVVEIASRPADEVVSKSRALVGADNSVGALSGLYALHNSRLMRGLGYADKNGDLQVTVRLRNGKTERRVLHPLVSDSAKAEEASFGWRFLRETYGPPIKGNEWVSSYRQTFSGEWTKQDSTRPLHLRELDKRYSFQLLPKQDAIYARMDGFDDSFLKFLDSLLVAVDQQKPRRLILDWRWNSGGDGSVVNAMRRALIIRQAKGAWRELYVLTGRKTFSATVMAINSLIDQIPFTIVGEPAGSALNHYGDATSRTYPRIGARLQVSTLWHQLSSSDDVREFIPVDVAAPFSSSDYINGRDPAVDPILRGDEMRSISAIAIAAGGAAARSALYSRREKSKAYEWWSPPSELDLRRSCQQLRDVEKRYADALEACALPTEMYPYYWGAWYNLGYAQTVAGRHWKEWLKADDGQRGADLIAAGLSSYRCLLTVDPTSFEAPDFRRYLSEKDPENRIPLPKGCPKP